MPAAGRAEPQVPVAVVEHGHHGHRREAGAGRHDVEASTVPDAERSIGESCAERAAEHANPQRAGAVLVDRAHAARRQPVGRPDVDEPAALESIEAGVGADPERAGPVHQQREDVVARQAGVLAEQGEAVPCEAREAGAAQRDPEHAVRITRDRLDPRGRQSLIATVAEETSGAVPDHAAAIGPRPEAAVRRFVERVDEGIGDGRRVGAIEDGEAEAIESNEAFVRAQPEIAVAGLGDGVDGILGQAFVGGPCLVHVPVEGLRWIERQHGAGPAGAPHPDGEGQNRRAEVGSWGRHPDVPASLPRFPSCSRARRASAVCGTIAAMGHERLHGWIARHRRVFALTGAGCSTASGIPDYRDDQGEWKRRPPVMIQAFRAEEAVYRRYWARAYAGWRRFAAAAPGAAHRAFAAWEAAGTLGRLVTQNVDGLHQRAGSRAVIDLHGRLDDVVCLGCGERTSRADLQDVMSEANPGWQVRGCSRAGRRRRDRRRGGRGVRGASL